MFVSQLKTIDSLKLCTTLKTFRNLIQNVEYKTRTMVIQEQRLRFNKRLDGMAIKQNLIEDRNNTEDLKGIKVKDTDLQT